MSPLSSLMGWSCALVGWSCPLVDCRSCPLVGCRPCPLVGWSCPLVCWSRPLVGCRSCPLVGWSCPLVGWSCPLVRWSWPTVGWLCSLLGWSCPLMGDPVHWWAADPVHWWAADPVWWGAYPVHWWADLVHRNSLGWFCPFLGWSSAWMAGAAGALIDSSIVVLLGPKTWRSGRSETSCDRWSSVNPSKKLTFADICVKAGVKVGIVDSFNLSRACHGQQYYKMVWRPSLSWDFLPICACPHDMCCLVRDDVWLLLPVWKKSCGRQGGHYAQNILGKWTQWAFVKCVLAHTNATSPYTRHFDRYWWFPCCKFGKWFPW